MGSSLGCKPQVDTALNTLRPRLTGRRAADPSVGENVGWSRNPGANTG